MVHFINNSKQKHAENVESGGQGFSKTRDFNLRGNNEITSNPPDKMDHLVGSMVHLCT